MNKLDVLLIDDNQDFTQDFTILSKKLFHVTSKHTGEKGLDYLQNHLPDAVLLDIQLGAGMDGIQVLEKIRDIYPDLPVVMITEFGKIDTAVQAMQMGALNYMTKDVNIRELAVLIHKELKNVCWKLLYKDQTESHLHQMIGHSLKMQKLRSMITRYARNASDVFIHGEPGTGKELVARAIHQSSSRKDNPFVAIDCGAITPSLFESEIFGHEKGAFTGAAERKPGKFEMADGGTLFLDEITNLELGLQAKLLRALQERSFYRVGGQALVHVDIRIIAATNKNVEQLVKEGDFRDDLYYRLNTLPLPVPPLRERTEDIPDLVNYFIVEYKKQNQDVRANFSEAAIEKLIKYDWPGNIRELKMNVDRMLALFSNREIRPDDLFLNIQSDTCDFQAYFDLAYSQAKDELLNKFKLAYFEYLMKKFQNNVARAADFAGIPRQSFYRILKELNL